MKFSVIIPVYNVVAELPRTMASLRAQTYHDFEIVLVDDGSTDGSAQLVDSYANVATVIHQPNLGVVAARQRGFEASKGEWILFVDGDDLLKPEALSQIESKIVQQDPDIVQFGYEMISGEKVDRIFPQEVGVYVVRDLLARMKTTPLEFVEMCIGNKCYRRDIAALAFADVGDVHISHSEDGLFAVAAFLRTRTLSFISDCLYEYVLRDASAVHRVNTRIVEEKVQFIERLGKLANESGRLTVDQIAKCLDFHAYQGCCYVFLMLKRNHASWAETRQVLGDLAKSEFYRRRNPEVRSIRRRLMYFLIRHPYLYFMASRCGIVR